MAIPVGVFSAVKQYSRRDYIVTTFTFFGTAMPVFWLAIMLVLIFAIKFREWGLPYMPAGGVTSVRTPPTGSVLDVLNAAPGGLLDKVVHLILPTITLSLLHMASWSRYMRASMLDVLRQDYVRTARAKGLVERLVIVKHAMRNALIPLVTIVVFTIPSVLAGQRSPRRSSPGAVWDGSITMPLAPTTGLSSWSSSSSAPCSPSLPHWWATFSIHSWIRGSATTNQAIGPMTMTEERSVDVLDAEGLLHRRRRASS